MKKLISLMLALLMVALCACGIAEGTEEAAAKTAFVRIKEGVTAQVFKKPGDKKAVDTLAEGTVCGLLNEETTEAGAAWFQVFYLNSRKEGTPGYINAEDAEQLTEEQLKALMDDPAMLNEVLDLIDALDAYLNKKTGTTGNGGTDLDLIAELKSLYKQAADGLQKLLNASGTPDLDKLAKEGKELADKAKDAAEDLIDEAKKAGKKLPEEANNLKDGVTDALSSMEGKNTDEAIDSLMDSISKSIEERTGKQDQKIEDALDKVSEALKKLDKDLGTGTADAIGGSADAMKKTGDWLNGDDFKKVDNAMKHLADKFNIDGFASGVGKKGIGSFLNELKDIFSKK